MLTYIYAVCETVEMYVCKWHHATAVDLSCDV